MDHHLRQKSKVVKDSKTHEVIKRKFIDKLSLHTKI